MQNYFIKTDASGKELVNHGNMLFPVASYDEYFSKFILGEVPWHWHEEIELIVVIEGSTKVFYIEGSLELKEGDGIFINCNVLHRLTQTSKTDCHIINFVLRPEFIGGRMDSIIYTKYVSPICSNSALQLIKFESEKPSDQSIINMIKKAFYTFNNSDFGYEMILRKYLTEAWRLLCCNYPEFLESGISATEDQNRINKIIHYVHENYSKKITVSTMANIASISESECYRLFQKALSTTPIDYLSTHRLQQAPIKLINSSNSILNISQELGFNSSSYFSKKFKEMYGCTPQAYRNQRKVSKDIPYKLHT